MTWWSKNDSNFVSGDLADLSSGGWVGDRRLPFLTEAMAEKILSYNRHAIENRMQRQIEALVKSKGFYSQNRGDKDDFIKLVKSNILNADQLAEIIQNDNWLILYENSDTSKMIRSILGPEKIFDMIKKMLKSKDITQTLVDFSENKFLTSYEGLTEEQSREIASIITKKLGSKPTKDTHGLDAKVFVDKWTMSPEDWNKFNSITNYIFIGKIEGKTPKISPDKGSNEYFTKIDRFKVTDFDKIEKLQMQAKYLGENLYGVVTEKGLLDQFKDNVEDMPKEVLMTIIQKAKPLYKSK